MFGKIFGFLVSVAVNGFFAIFVAMFFYIILAIVFLFAMIPVWVIAGDNIAKQIIEFAGRDFGYKIVYIIVFVSMMMDDLDIPNFKTLFKKWREKQNKA